jgi:hypothetical protein
MRAAVSWRVAANPVRGSHRTSSGGRLPQASGSYIIRCTPVAQRRRIGAAHSIGLVISCTPGDWTGPVAPSAPGQFFAGWCARTNADAASARRAVALSRQ